MLELKKKIRSAPEESGKIKAKPTVAESDEEYKVLVKKIMHTEASAFSKPKPKMTCDTILTLSIVKGIEEPEEQVFQKTKSVERRPVQKPTPVRAGRFQFH